MGTRGAFGFHVDGADKATYNHFDSYPDSLGCAIVEYVAAHSDDHLAKVAKGLVLIDGKTDPTPEQIKKYGKWYDGGVASQKASDWYCLLREAQGKPEAWEEGLDVIVDGSSFLADSLFCEWAYLINVDDGVLEVYRGFNKNPKAPGRYAGRQRDTKDTTRISVEYFGIALKTTVPFAQLRGLTKGDLNALLTSWEDREDEDES